MVVTWSTPGTNVAGADSAFTASPITFTAAPLGTGDVWVFIEVEGFSNAPLGAAQSVVVDGISATQFDIHTEATGNQLSVWKAVGVIHSTGNIVVTPNAGGWGGWAAAWGVVNGNNDPTMTYFDTNGGNAPLGPVTGSVATNGLAVCVMCGPFGTPANPTTWSGATVDTNMEGGLGVGNQDGFSGATVSAAGAASVTITSAGWNGIKAIMAMASFPPSAAPPAAGTAGVQGLASAEW